MIRFLSAFAAMMAIATAAKRTDGGPGAAAAASRRFRRQLDYPDLRAADRLVGGARHPDHGHQLPAVHHRVRDFARGYGPGHDAGQHDPGQPCAVHDVLRDGPHIRPVPGKTASHTLLEDQITEEEAIDLIADPFRDFMLVNTRPKDLALFVDLATERGQSTETDGEIDLRVLVPAFMISEIRRGFEIGFLVVLPFLVIDLVVATITMAMGMMMLPPTAISLPSRFCSSC